MSMYSHVVAFKPADEKWKKMKDVYEVCSAAGVAIPPEVSDFFNDGPPDDHGVTIEEEQLRSTGALQKYSAEMQDGFEVYIDKLPKDVTIIRFYNSY